MRIVPAALALWRLAHEQRVGAGLPCSQVRLIVPYPAGGATDVATRVVAERLDAALKKPVMVENRGGATGNIGTVAVVNAPPDGCTLLVNATVIATFPHSFSKLSYDPFKDLAPVGGVGVTPTLVDRRAVGPGQRHQGPGGMEQEQARRASTTAPPATACSSISRSRKSRSAPAASSSTSPTAAAAPR